MTRVWPECCQKSLNCGTVPEAYPARKRARGRTTAAATILLLIFVSSRVQAIGPPASQLVPGLYENFRYDEDAGDVAGIGVFIVWSSDGLHSSFWALVQTAEGMPANPVLVKVDANGTHIEFSLDEGNGRIDTFKGAVSKKALVGTFEGEKVTLKRVHRGFSW